VAVIAALLAGTGAAAALVAQPTGPTGPTGPAARNGAPRDAASAHHPVRHGTGLGGTSVRRGLRPAAAVRDPFGAAHPVSAVIRVAPGSSLDSVHPVSGGTYLFRRGATYTGTLSVSADNVVVGAYGSGPNPVFRRSTAGADVVVTGNGDHLAHLRLTGQGYQPVPGCGPASTAGYELGIDVRGTHDTIDSVVAYGNLYAGVYVEPAGSYATIRHSVFDRVNSLDPANLGAGAFGILIWGDHNTVDADTFANQSTCSPAYGKDGSGVEIYHGSYNLIEHSTGRNDADFTELGGRGATTNTYLDNTFAGPGEFLVTRGSGDTVDGPVYDTILTGNVAHGAVVSYGWRPGGGPLLVMRDNHVSALSQDGGLLNKGGTVIGF